MIKIANELQLMTISKLKNLLQCLFISIALMFSSCDKQTGLVTKDDCSTIRGFWMRNSQAGIEYWDFNSHQQGGAIKGKLENGNCEVTDGFYINRNYLDTLILSKDDKLDTFGMKLTCKTISLRKIQNKVMSKDTMLYQQVFGSPCNFAETQYVCPDSPSLKELSRFYAYLRMIRIKYWETILLLLSFVILFKHIKQRVFLFSFLKFSLIISLLILGIYYGSENELYKERQICIFCNLSPTFYPQYTLYEFGVMSEGTLIKKGSNTYWVFAFINCYMIAAIFSPWLVWKKHKLKFDFGNVILNTIARIFSEFSVHIVIIMMWVFLILLFLTSLIHTRDHYNVLVLAISLFLYFLFCRHIFYNYFYFDKLEIERIREEAKSSWEKVWNWLTHLLW